MRFSLLLILSLAAGGCSSVLHHQPLPPGTLAARLEHAGENYQATEAAPAYRQERPNQAAPGPR